MIFFGFILICNIGLRCISGEWFFVWNDEVYKVYQIRQKLNVARVLGSDVNDVFARYLGK